MTNCLFVSDLHGDPNKYQKFFKAIRDYSPDIIFIGGDLLPSGTKAFARSPNFDIDFITEYLTVQFAELRQSMKEKYPDIYLIMGNDDCRSEEDSIKAGDDAGLWHYSHNKKFQLGHFTIYGYAYVPPSPFMLKDWEKYDVSRYVDPGCVSPEQGYRTVEVEEHEIRYSTIAEDLAFFIGNDDLTNAVFLFHTPPHMTKLDYIATNGRMIEFVPIDPHIGSIAVRRMIETCQPLITLHGHAHESAEITGSWHDRIGRTFLYSAAHDGPLFALVRFELEKPEGAKRLLL
jgi:uncharacterized protein